MYGTVTELACRIAWDMFTIRNKFGSQKVPYSVYLKLVHVAQGARCGAVG